MAETVPEYEIGSVVLDRDGDAWQLGEGGWTSVVREANTVDQPTSSLVSILGPLTLLHGPAHDAQVRADDREKIAVAIEAMESFAHGKNEISRAHRIGYGTAKRAAARIARAGGE